MNMWMIVALVSIALNVGFIVYILLHPTKPQGTMLIDIRHKNDDYIRFGFMLDSKHPIGMHQKSVTFKIDNKAEIGEYDTDKLSDGTIL